MNLIPKNLPQEFMCFTLADTDYYYYHYCMSKPDVIFVITLLHKFC